MLKGSKIDPPPVIIRQVSTISDQPRFIIRFIQVEDIPPADYRSRCDPYIRSYIGHWLTTSKGGPELQKISDLICTSKKLDCTSAIWNSYRDFRIAPPPDAILIVDILHANSDPNKPDQLLGSVNIPISTISNGEVNTFFFANHKNDRKKNPKFSITLQRVWMNAEPPHRKTFFLIRHGESKWNEAQSKIYIGGMILDRDHGLTEQGMKQAAELNQRWQAYSLYRHYESQTNQKEKQNASNNSQVAINNTGNLLDGYDEPSPRPTNQKKSVQFQSADTHSVFDFMNDEEVRPSIETKLPAEGSLLHSSSYDDEEEEFDIDESLQRFTESIKIGDDNKVVDLSVGEEGDVDDDDEFEDRLTRLTIAQNWNQDPKKSSKTKGEKEMEKRTSKSEQVDRRRLSISPEDLLHDLHNNRFIAIDANIEKRRKEYMKLFLHSDRVYSSPLTRALETAVIAMEGHTALPVQGITLYSTIREIKKLGGFDTVGIECGEGIRKRLRSELQQILGTKRMEALTKVMIYPNDTEQPWWTPMTTNERTPEQQERVREFITFSRYCDSKLPVFVGHSLFFKAFYSKRISNELLRNRQSLSENLLKFRLSNASILAVTVKFTEDVNGQSDALIIDADLIFGGGFHGLEASEENPSTRRSASIRRNESTDNTASPQKGNYLAGSFETTGQNIQQVFNSISSKEFQTNFQQKKEAITKGVKKLGEKIYDFFDA